MRRLLGLGAEKVFFNFRINKAQVVNADVAHNSTKALFGDFGAILITENKGRI
jgi:hypothetical protein